MNELKQIIDIAESDKISENLKVGLMLTLAKQAIERKESPTLNFIRIKDESINVDMILAAIRKEFESICQKNDDHLCAERYRWLRTKSLIQEVIGLFCRDSDTLEELDLSIDEAMKEESKA